MHCNADPTFSTTKKSKYYMDPTQKNSKVKIIKPADPEKLKAYYNSEEYKRKMKRKKLGKKSPWGTNTYINY